MRLRLNNRGDTIIEVLMAIIVISGVLAAVYVTLQRTTNNARQAQERSQAVKLLESQTERLKGLNNDPTIFSQSYAFCIAPSTNTVITATNPTRGVDTVTSPYVALNSDTFSQYVASCKDSTEGITYYLSIQRNGDNTNGQVFTVRVRWDKAGGDKLGGHEEASVVYRLWQ
jgi:type II secretory pathway pseudopilin PulG